ncbi:MAG: flavin reductase family protein [Saprospiraceae bacterium]|nr:flavin reductase family protein [Saprospiraceae bacterium]MBK7524076.1 flavin reductase family protein [Saprospiraceae bacterium]MBK8372129.1 flavin reductase family protein [Saprospiraceae bacterium]MBK8818607.1 flavin reductase family protein [Saprospiraceae bacterium]MBK9042386.1 flavin reductase family protein [Saprospiraceae bacterium]
MKKGFDPKNMATKDLHQLIIGSVAPRPIAFVSTFDENGNLNLAPYSFFNAFSSNPPILVFSSNRRVTNNTTKDTLHNILTTKKAVINAVSYDIVRQMSLSSVEFDPGVSEFEKVGLTPQPSHVIDVPGVKESPVNMECVVKDIIALGEHGGAGHLIICEVVYISIDENKFTDGKLDPYKLDLMARMGRNYYVRANGDAIMEIHQSVTDKPIGFDGLPDDIVKSNILTGNEIAAMACLLQFPDAEEKQKVLQTHFNGIKPAKELLHQKAAVLIREKKVEEALALLMA